MLVELEAISHQTIYMGWIRSVCCAHGLRVIPKLIQKQVLWSKSGSSALVLATQECCYSLRSADQGSFPLGEDAEQAKIHLCCYLQLAIRDNSGDSPVHRQYSQGQWCGENPTVDFDQCLEIAGDSFPYVCSCSAGKATGSRERK